MPSLHRLAAFSLALLLAPLWVVGQQPPAPGLPPSANDLVREAIKNELKDNSSTYYMYRLIKKKPDGSEMREVIQTKGITIARLVALNDKPLSSEQQDKEDKRLERLLNDADYLRSKQKEQREDDQRTRRMLEALPDAFLYEYKGIEQRPEGEVVVLAFKPNPNYQPPSREQQVYRGMEGTLEIALPTRRVALIKAKLFRDVNFGWGILGHLDQGGEFLVAQARVHDQHWEPTRMVLNFSGKVLLFKPLKIRQDQTSTAFQPVPEMSVAQALEFLKKRDGEWARTQEK